MPLIRCLDPKQSEYVLQEVHFGSCGSRVGPRMLAKKIVRLGYYWPTMYHDAQELVKKCKKCQVHSNVCHLPQHDMVPVTSSWPFSQWGIDIVGLFPLAPLLIVFVPLPYGRSFGPSIFFKISTNLSNCLSSFFIAFDLGGNGGGGLNSS